MTDWQARLNSVAGPDTLMWDEERRVKYSRDYYHFSPILEAQLDGLVAECIARPADWDEFDAILEVACQYSLPVTVRGAGTGNYGQAVPLAGGIVLDMTLLNRILDISGDYASVEAGCRIGKLESELRLQGREMRTYPSTFQTATIGGFVCGGSGGIGSVTWGTLRDGLVRAVHVRALRPGARPQRIAEPSDMAPFLHAYGTTGIVTAVELRTAPRESWEQWAIAFDSLASALAFGSAAAQDPVLAKRLVSIHEWPIPQYFTPLKLPARGAYALLETAEKDSGRLRERCREYGGDPVFHLPADRYHHGSGLSDFTWNHTTLWARKCDPELTYLQVRFDPNDPVAQLREIQSEFPEFLCHIEWIRDGGELTAAGLPIVRFLGDDRMRRLMERCESLGMSVANPHTWRLELGGRLRNLAELWRAKHIHDPLGLLNPHKLEPEPVQLAQPVWGTCD